MTSWHNDSYPWYPQPNPNVYIPPPQTFNHPSAGYWDQSRWDRPEASTNPYYFCNAFHSRKYPSLNPLLATDTTLLRYDVRRKPQDNIHPSAFRSHPATMVPAVPGSTHIRLVSKAMPWTIEIVVPYGNMITCEIIWEAMYEALQQPLADSEWALIISDMWRRTTIENAAQKRQDAGDPVTNLKRIDWLGEAAIFKGLERDEHFQRQRLLPGDDPSYETWVMKFGS